MNGPDYVPILPAGRIRLRPLAEEDIPELFAVFSDPEVMRYWSTPPFSTFEEAATLLADIRRLASERTLYQWGIALLEGDRVIGTCTLAHVDEKQRRAEVGVALARRAWGHGYAREALLRLLEHAFGALELRRLEADVDPRNARSLRTFEALGFRREGLLRERWLVAGEAQDSVLLGLLRHESPHAREGLAPPG